MFEPHGLRVKLWKSKVSKRNKKPFRIKSYTTFTVGVPVMTLFLVTATKSAFGSHGRDATSLVKVGRVVIS